MNGIITLDEARAERGERAPVEEPIYTPDSPLGRLEQHVAKFEGAARKLRLVICTIRRRYPRIVRWQPRSRVYRNRHGAVRRKSR